VKAIVAALGVLAACGSGGAQPSPFAGSASGSAARGSADASRLPPEAAYMTLCAVCHGREMQGGAADHAPSLANPTFLATASDNFLRRSIAFGRPGTSMAAYGKQLGGPLDDAAVTGLLGYIRGKGGPPKDLAPLTQQGDVTRGAAVYQKNCQSCHGDTVARGEAIHLANPRFLEVATDPFIRYAIVNGRPGTKMIAWKDALSEQDIDDVVAYVRNFAGKAQAPQELLPPPTGDEPLVLNPKGKQPQFKLTEDKYVSVDQVKAALDAKDRMIIIDARPPSEWRQVHVAGAVSIPYHDMKRLDDVPKDGTWVIAYCACPHHLSGIVMEELRKRGYTHAVVLDEGILEWHRRGYPVVAAPGVKPPPPVQPAPTPLPPAPLPLPPRR
jgi:cytochrome c oxidase cbb3-type subunit 3/ubiquinol-cytochrome c reductase cytochrome c subunit